MLFLFRGCLKLSFKNGQDYRISGFTGLWAKKWTGLQDSKIVVMCILEIMYILFKIINNELAKRKK
jgi:hypothetical protein